MSWVMTEAQKKPADDERSEQRARKEAMEAALDAAQTRVTAVGVSETLRQQRGGKWWMGRFASARSRTPSQAGVKYRLSDRELTARADMFRRSKFVARMSERMDLLLMARDPSMEVGWGGVFVRHKVDYGRPPIRMYGIVM